MRSEFDRQKRYFAASNSAEGFVNYFPQIFGGGRCQRLFVVKGGPGTGKSCFMRQVGKQAEEKGYEVTYYYCSSDPESLDGILIGGIGVGFVDGTAPHVWEPRSVGAFEQILNLGDFWDRDALAARREHIEALYVQKSACYENAYRYLTAYGCVARTMGQKALAMAKLEKLSRAAARTIKKHVRTAGTDFCEEVAICDSIGMGGRIRFDTYERTANKLYVVKDCCDTAHLFFEALYAQCRQLGLSVRVSRHPILPERIDALTLTDSGVTFTLCGGTDDDSVINMRRFIRDEDYKVFRAEQKEKSALADALILCAEEEFAKVRRHHFAIESLFTDTMDFAAKEAFTEEFCHRLFLGSQKEK